MAYIIIYSISLIAVAIWHGMVWRSRGHIAKIHKSAANTLKAFLWATLSTFWYLQYPFTWGIVFPAMAAAVSLQAAIWWIAFDLAVNIAGGKPLFHMGNTAKTDKIFTDYLSKGLAQVITLLIAIICLILLDSKI